MKMGCVVSIPFVTIPSIVYSIAYFILIIPLYPIGFLFNIFMGKPSHKRALRLADAISVKILPIVLIIVLPVIFYFYVWVPLAWIFFAWMIIYFITRKYSGVSEKHARLTETYKEWEELEDRMQRESRTKKDDK